MLQILEVEICVFYRLYELKVEKDVSESQWFEMCMSSGSKTPKTYLIVLWMVFWSIEIFQDIYLVEKLLLCLQCIHPQRQYYLCFLQYLQCFRAEGLDKVVHGISLRVCRGVCSLDPGVRKVFWQVSGILGAQYSTLLLKNNSSTCEFPIYSYLQVSTWSDFDHLHDLLMQRVELQECFFPQDYPGCILV